MIPENPLEIVGGFENYQSRLYQAMREKLLELPKSAREELQRETLDKNIFKDEIWGLRNGIEYFLEHQEYITSEDFERLASPLRLAQNKLFHSELLTVLTTPEDPKIPVPYLFPEGDSLNKRTTEYLQTLFAIQEASDRRIKELTGRTN